MVAITVMPSSSRRGCRPGRSLEVIGPPRVGPCASVSWSCPSCAGSTPGGSGSSWTSGATTRPGPTTTSPGAASPTARGSRRSRRWRLRPSPPRRSASAPSSPRPNFRHPVPFAKELMSLDDLSGGRFQLGVGAGGPGFDATVLGAEPLTPGQRVERSRRVRRAARPATDVADHDVRRHLVHRPGGPDAPRLRAAAAAAVRGRRQRPARDAGGRPARPGLGDHRRDPAGGGRAALVGDPARRRGAPRRRAGGRGPRARRRRSAT